MNLALVAFMMVSATPVFFSRLSQMPLWLVLQGLALAWFGLVQHGALSEHAVVGAIEVVLLRGVLAPWLYARMMRLRDEPDVGLMPSNLFTWALAALLISLAFRFADAIPSEGDMLTLGVIASFVVMALFLLSTNDRGPAQLVALLYLENAILLFESLLPGGWPLPAHIAVSTVYVLSVGIGCWLLGFPDRLESREVV